MQNDVVAGFESIFSIRVETRNSSSCLIESVISFTRTSRRPSYDVNTYMIGCHDYTYDVNILLFSNKM